MEDNKFEYNGWKYFKLNNNRWEIIVENMTHCFEKQNQIKGYIDNVLNKKK